MWDSRIAEIRALRPGDHPPVHPGVLRPAARQGRYHFETLDRSVDTILRTGAKPLMCICFKPRVLFPVVNHDIVEPNDYGQWEELIFQLVRHYRQRGAGIRYWEVANEPDIGESGGCPYRFKPDSYCRYYQHTVAAILRADPNALVGGPALAGWRSPILPALLDFASKDKVPLHFVSWHIYSSDPKRDPRHDRRRQGPAQEVPRPAPRDVPRRVEHEPRLTRRCTRFSRASWPRSPGR